MANKINIGCGKSLLEGYKNVDSSPYVGADECYDLDRAGIVEKSDSMDEVFAGCVLEQVKDLAFVMNECWRVLKDGGKLRGYVPSTDPRVLFLDPADIRFFQQDSFKYFVKSERQWQQFGKHYGFNGWSSVETKINENGILHFTLTK